MDALGTLTSGENTALVFAFLQADCGGSEYNRELFSLGKELNLVRYMKSNGCLEDGNLETDGNLACSVAAAALGDIQPSVERQLPRDRMRDAAIQQVAEGLREIAAQLERDALHRSVQNLNSRISTTPPDQWKHHLAAEVERAMRQGVGLEHLPQERVIMALTLTLVKGVCEQAPGLMRSLFSTTLQYINPARAR